MRDAAGSRRGGGRVRVGARGGLLDREELVGDGLGRGGLLPAPAKRGGSRRQMWDCYGGFLSHQD